MHPQRLFLLYVVSNSGKRYWDCKLPCVEAQIELSSTFVYDQEMSTKKKQVQYGALVWCLKQSTISEKLLWFWKNKVTSLYCKNIFWLLFNWQSKQRHYLPSALLQHLFSSHSVGRHLLGFFQHLLSLKFPLNLNGLACKLERETVILRQFTWRCYT